MSGAIAAFFVILAMLLLCGCAVGARRIAAKLDRVQRARWPFDEGDA